MDLATAATTFRARNEPGQCDSGNDYDGRMGVRISSIFVILLGSSFAAIFPVWAQRQLGNRDPPVVMRLAYFICKFFGSGVILATAFMHLLAPAVEALTNECLTGPITDYDWAEAIALMTIIVLFFLEILLMRYTEFGSSEDGRTPSDSAEYHRQAVKNDLENGQAQQPEEACGACEDQMNPKNEKIDSVPSQTVAPVNDVLAESYSAQLTAVFVLEFGIVFHSIFVGLTLAVTGSSEFNTLYVVLVFHQTFEGLGLGSRLADIPWPAEKRWTPYLLGGLYGLTTPIAIAIGLGVRTSYPAGSQTTLIVNGVFDSISAGILIYTALVELIAHEFMFSPSMQRAPISKVLFAFGCLCAGTALMSLLAKWA